MTNGFPKTEEYGLKSQMRRAAVSIPSNIAEGQARCSSGEFRQFLGIARGSLAELVTQTEIATRLHYLEEQNKTVLLKQCSDIGKMTAGLLSALPQIR